MKLTSEQIDLIGDALTLYYVDLLSKMKAARPKGGQIIFDRIAKVFDLTHRLQNDREYNDAIQLLKYNGQYKINGELTEAAIEVQRERARNYVRLNPDKIAYNKMQARARKAARQQPDSDYIPND